MKSLKSNLRGVVLTWTVITSTFFWTFWLTNLKAYLEHNITLHAKGLNQDETMDLVNS